jgi:hypothetical protein
MEDTEKTKAHHVQRYSLMEISRSDAMCELDFHGMEDLIQSTVKAEFHLPLCLEEALKPARRLLTFLGRDKVLLPAGVIFATILPHSR